MIWEVTIHSYLGSTISYYERKTATFFKALSFHMYFVSPGLSKIWNIFQQNSRLKIYVSGKELRCPQETDGMMDAFLK